MASLAYIYPKEVLMLRCLPIIAFLILFSSLAKGQDDHVLKLVSTTLFDTPLSRGDVKSVSFRVTNTGRDSLNDTIILVRRVNNARVDTVFRSPETVGLKGFAGDTANLVQPQYEASSNLKTGGGNIIVIWPVGFSKPTKVDTTDSKYEDVTVLPPLSVLIDEPTDKSLQLFPNPSQGRLYLQRNAEISEIRVFTATGRPVPYRFNGEELWLDNPKPGLYIVEFSSDEGERFRQTVMIQ